MKTKWYLVIERTMRRLNRYEFKQMKAAQRNADRINKAGHYSDRVVVMSAEFYADKTRGMGEWRTNLMSGKPVWVAHDTPLSCDPSSETYWSM